jgi:hypothetical protein
MRIGLLVINKKGLKNKTNPGSMDLDFTNIFHLSSIHERVAALNRTTFRTNFFIFITFSRCIYAVGGLFYRYSTPTAEFPQYD